MIRVPTEVTEYKQWVLWRRVEVNARTAKMPISPWSGKAAACNKPQTWTTFQHACIAHKQFKSDGIGFVFTEADPFCGIDLDKCREKNGRMTEESLRLIRHMSSYAEISPSGDGSTSLSGHNSAPPAGGRLASRSMLPDDTLP